jgi:NTE family protein
MVLYLSFLLIYVKTIDGRFCMKIDGVFSGGGVKALAFVGALEVLEEKGFEFVRLAGTSAGSIISALLSAGYKANEMKKIFLELEFSNLLEEPKFSGSIPFLKWLLMYFRLGVYKGDSFEQWVDQLLQWKGIQTFGDLPEGSLKIIGSDISLHKMVVFPDDLPRFYNLNPKSFPIAKAVRISSSIPFFFIPEKLKNSSFQQSIMVDGGILSNFPIWIFTNGEKKQRPILGLKLSSTYNFEKEHKIDGAFEMYKEIFTTMMQAHDARHIENLNKQEVMFIPTGNIEATDFHINKNGKEKLFHIGRESAEKFLKKWSY